MFLLCVPLLVALYLISGHLLRKLLHKAPPTPFPTLPIIGHFHLLKEPLNRTFVNLANKYGPIFSFKLASRPVIMVSSPELVEECLTTNDIVFCNRPSGFIVGKYVGYEYTSPIWSPYGPHWRNLRRILATTLLSSHRLQLLADLRASELRLLIRRLQENIGTSGGHRIVEIKPFLHDMAMNIITRMIYGKRYYGVEAKEGKRFKEMMEKNLKLSNDIYVGDMIPYLRWLDWWKERRFRKFVEESEALMQELMEEHRTKVKESNNGDGDSYGESNNGKPLAQVLLKLQESEPEYYKDEVIFGIITDLVIAGSDTSSSTMEWALSLLLNHPEELKKAQTEIDNLIGHERLLEESDLRHLPYLQCIINETLRMYPPAPNLVPHESSKDCIVGGYRIPRGTMLQVNLLAIQNDPKLWGDPENFRPERFEGLDAHKIGFKMMPFGAGRRSCPGAGLAIRVLGLTIGSLIQCFDWDRVDDKLVDMTEKHGFEMHKETPLQARLRLQVPMIKQLSHM